MGIVFDKLRKDLHVHQARVTAIFTSLNGVSALPSEIHLIFNDVYVGNIVSNIQGYDSLNIAMHNNRVSFIHTLESHSINPSIATIKEYTKINKHTLS